MKISEEQRELLRKCWAENGECRSCGWHNAYYEVQEWIEDRIIDNDIEADGSIWIMCHCDEDSEEDYSSHRGSNIYDWKLSDGKN